MECFARISYGRQRRVMQGFELRTLLDSINEGEKFTYRNTPLSNGNFNAWMNFLMNEGLSIKEIIKGINYHTIPSKAAIIVYWNQNVDKLKI